MGRRYWPGKASPLPDFVAETASRDEIERSGGALPARLVTAVWVMVRGGRFRLSGVFPIRSDALSWISANHVGDYVLLSTIGLTVSTRSAFECGGCSPFKTGANNTCQTVENKSPSQAKSSPPSSTTD